MASTAPAAAPPAAPDAAPTPPADGAEGAARSADALADLTRPSRIMRLRSWLRVAYTDVSSTEHRVLLEWIIMLVIVSVVATVMEHDVALEEQLHWPFVIVESVVLAFFVADYALNLTFASNKRSYVLSFWGIVDLLAILPGFLLFLNFTQIKILKGLRGLRFLRFLRVVKIAREAQRRAQLLEQEEEPVQFLDLQMIVIFATALLLFVGDDSLRNLLLGIILISACTMALRRWLVARQHASVSVLVLIATVITAIFYALNLDFGGHFERAVGVLLGTVLVTLVSWTQIEAPAGGL